MRPPRPVFPAELAPADTVSWFALGALAGALALRGPGLRTRLSVLLRSEQWANPGRVAELAAVLARVRSRLAWPGRRPRRPLVPAVGRPLALASGRVKWLSWLSPGEAAAWATPLGQLDAGETRRSSGGAAGPDTNPGQGPHGPGSAAVPVLEEHGVPARCPALSATTG